MCASDSILDIPQCGFSSVDAIISHARDAHSCAQGSCIRHQENIIMMPKGSHAVTENYDGYSGQDLLPVN